MKHHLIYSLIALLCVACAPKSQEGEEQHETEVTVVDSVCAPIPTPPTEAPQPTEATVTPSKSNVQSSNVQKKSKPQQTEPVLFNETKPVAVEIARERSFYQANRIAQRLSQMDVETHIISRTGDDGQWYSVISGSFAYSAQAEQYERQLDSRYRIHPVAIVSYTDLEEAARVPAQKETVTEQQRIDANPPSVPQEIVQVAEQYPQSETLDVNEIGMLMLSDKGIEAAKSKNINLPHGITLEYLKDKNCTALSTVTYEDNLHGDKITLNIAKRRSAKQEKKTTASSIATERNKAALTLCSKICKKILATGEYTNEQKVHFEADAYTKLKGYKVTFEDRGKTWSYYVFTDEAGDYIYMAQATIVGDSEIISFITEIGKSGGLKEYDEFHNTFYTIADNQVDDDEFIGYYISRLTDGYARDRQYAEWAKCMVGHMYVDCFFYNRTKGQWHFQLFDLLNEQSERKIYNSLYRNNLSESSKRTIYGDEGAAIYQHTLQTDSLILAEVNLGFGRYIVAVCGSPSFTERDLILRTQSLQFQRGGYFPKEQ